MARPARPEPKVFLTDEFRAGDIEAYRARLFAHASGEHVLGEKSTSYIEHPESAGRIREVLGEAEILVMLRDPVRRAVSNWRFSVENGLEQRSLDTALTDNLAGAQSWDPGATSVSPFAYLERGRYADYLDPWLETFPTSMHVCFFEELVADPAAVGSLLKELGVDPVVPDAVHQRVNESTDDEPTLNPKVEEKVRDFFSSSDATLQERLGRALPWHLPLKP